MTRHDSSAANTASRRNPLKMSGKPYYHHKYSKVQPPAQGPASQRLKAGPGPEQTSRKRSMAFCRSFCYIARMFSI